MCLALPPSGIPNDKTGNICGRFISALTLEAHEHAFAYFGGVFRTLRYDNMAIAGEEDSARPAAHGDRPDHRVPFALGISKRVLQSGQAGTRRAAWKESWAGIRRNCLVPVPEAERSGGLNEQLLDGVRGEPRPHASAGRSMTVGRSQRARAGASCCRWQKKDFRFEEVLYPLIVDGKGE